MKIKDFALFAIIIVGFFGYKFYQKHMNDNSSEIVEENQTVSPQVAVAKILPQDEVNDILQANEYQCKDLLEKWCQMLLVQGEKGEGLLSREKLLIGAIELPHGQELSDSFKALEKKKQKEILALKRVLQRDFLNNFRRHGNWDSVQFIVFSSSDLGKKTEFLIEIKKDFDPTKFSGILIDTALTESFNYGNLEGLSLIQDNYSIIYFE